MSADEKKHYFMSVCPKSQEGTLNGLITKKWLSLSAKEKQDWINKAKAQDQTVLSNINAPEIPQVLE